LTEPEGSCRAAAAYSESSIDGYAQAVLNFIRRGRHDGLRNISLRNYPRHSADIGAVAVSLQQRAALTEHKCDLCDRVRDCLQKIIGDKEHDICQECWKALEEKLRGKGRETKFGEPLVLLPDTQEPRQKEGEPEFPGEPPIVWSTASCYDPRLMPADPLPSLPKTKAAFVEPME